MYGASTPCTILNNPKLGYYVSNSKNPSERYIKCTDIEGCSYLKELTEEVTPFSLDNDGTNKFINY